MSESAEERARRAVHPHLECEDCFYSCPLSEEGTCNENAATECTCGRDTSVLSVEIEIRAAESAARAEGIRIGQERMRERAAQLSESCQIYEGYFDTRQIWTNTTATGIARAIRALEVEDG